MLLLIRFVHPCDDSRRRPPVVRALETGPNSFRRRRAHARSLRDRIPHRAARFMRSRWACPPEAGCGCRVRIGQGDCSGRHLAGVTDHDPPIHSRPGSRIGRRDPPCSPIARIPAPIFRNLRSPPHPARRRREQRGSRPNQEKPPHSHAPGCLRHRPRPLPPAPSTLASACRFRSNNRRKLRLSHGSNNVAIQSHM